eukprot:m.239812 g.239812  ORF g.239812 m.239812 type:complete len:313 (+) comp14088_c0_seq1:60-998(+)
MRAIAIVCVLVLAGAVCAEGKQVLVKTGEGLYDIQGYNRTTTGSVSTSSLNATLNLDLAEHLVYYAGVAYCTSAPIENWSCNLCKHVTALKDVKVSQNTKTRAFGYTGVDHSSSTIYVAFQGSSDITQWIEDFKFEKTPLGYPGASSSVEVHLGFHQSYLSVQDDIVSNVAILAKANPSYRIIVTGHSLGAAIASLCSLDLSIKFPKATVITYTFGQPRVGNKAYYSFFKASSVSSAFRFIHNRDIVPHLPLEDMGFHHTATEAFYTETYSRSAVKVCNGSGEDSSCADHFSIDLSVSDHLDYLSVHVSDCE